MEDTVNLALSLSHDELLEITKSSLCTLVSCDPLLSDLPTDIITEEVLSQIAVEHGQAITIFISRHEEPSLKVVVPNNATVCDLKKAVARHFELFQNRNNSKVKISWKYIWRTYDLSFDSIILNNNSSSIEHYGVMNKVTLTFRKKLRKESKQML